MGCNSSKINISRSSNTQQDPDEDYIEGIVCQENDIGENEMKTFDLDEGKVLLVKQNGKISALGTKCTHYGAPLVNAALGDGRIRCQWHGACFNLATGDIEDFPGLDSLPCYRVTIEDSKVKVRARKSELEANKRMKPMVKRNAQEAQNIVVVGGGPAGETCVEALRQEGFEGRITLVCREKYSPYDRVKVSKAMDFEIEKAQFRDESFYRDNDIEILKGVEATAVNTSAKTVTLSNGKQLPYDRLFIATGCQPRKLKVSGVELKNVIVLRDYEHAKYTNDQLSEDKEVVVLGSSFVGMEAANYCLNKVKKVTVVMRDALPFRPLLGPEIGAALMRLFQEKGVHFVANSGIKQINSDGSGAISSVELADGQILKADLLIMGVGSTFNTCFLRGSGVEVRDDGSVEVDEHLRTNVDGVFAGGDIAYAPVWGSHHDRKSAIGHFSLAHSHGKIAALNMLNKRTPLRTVPFFWTMLFGKGVRYAGHGAYTDIVYAGNVDDYKFAAFFLDGDEVVAACSCGMDPVVSRFAERMAQGRKLFREDLKEDPLAWSKKM